MFELIGQAVGVHGAQTGAEKKFIKFFMEPTEQFICALGNNFLQNYLTSGGISSGFAAVSNKRVYFKGKCFFSDGGRYKLIQVERVVDVKDITGTGYTRLLRLSLLLKALIPLPFILLVMALTANFNPGPALPVMALMDVIIAIVLYLANRLNLFEIQYAGGKIAFNSKWYDKSEVDDFQRQIRLAKDNAAQNDPLAAAINRMVAAPTPVSVAASQGSTADELKKFADLLAQGAITQDEYNQAKADLLRR